MNLVYLSPHFPHHYHQFCKNLQQFGANVLGIGDMPFGDLDPVIQDALNLTWTGKILPPFIATPPGTGPSLSGQGSRGLDQLLGL